MALRRHEGFPLEIERVVDSDTLIGWLTVSPDVKSRYRLRLQGIEGGEAHDPRGPAGTAALAAALAEANASPFHWLGSLLTRDQFGRLVGQVQRADGCLLNLLLLQRGSHWRRDRSGLETH